MRKQKLHENAAAHLEPGEAVAESVLVTNTLKTRNTALVATAPREQRAAAGGLPALDRPRLDDRLVGGQSTPMWRSTPAGRDR